MTDYQALLAKYIAFVRDCEGIDFIDSRRRESQIEFTDDEWTELERVRDELPE